MKNLFFLAMMLLGAAFTRAQERIPVTGTVTDEAGKPLAGVSVVIKDTSTGTSTGSEGKYVIVATKGRALVFSLAGYQTQETVVTGPQLDVTMIKRPPKIQKVVMIEDVINASRAEEDIVTMEDVVVVGSMPERPRETFTGSATVFAHEPLQRSKHIRREKAAAASAQVMSEPYRTSYSNSYSHQEEYAGKNENRFLAVDKDPLSTFSLETDGASYSNARRALNSGRMPDPASVRVEEFINYFSYDYPEPAGNDPLRIGYQVGECPWNEAHKLVSIAVKAREISSAKLPKANFVFLIDVSGSMDYHNKLPLVKSSLKLLVNNLRAEDRVAIVVYASSTGEVLSSTSGSDKQKIREALDRLSAGGSTAGGAGLQLAYKIARQNFVEGGNNRIILCTDGDFNVGVSSNEGLESLVEKERKSGVFLTVLGYGMGNYKDSKLQTLAEKGNGNHAYIDNLQEANKVLVGEFGGTMYAVAKDVKLQVEFNPAAVKSYRLVGYESRLLADEDFNDDTKDAGEIGAGHTVTALYEVVPAGSKSNVGTVDPLKYQPSRNKSATFSPAKELMTIKLRYKEPEGTASKLLEVPVIESEVAVSDDFRFVSAVAMFGQLLSRSDFTGDGGYDKAISLARSGLGNDPNGYRREFIRLAEMAKGLDK